MYLWTLEELMNVYHQHKAATTVKGHLAGPMIMGQTAVCFRPGNATTLVATACRMAIFPPTHNPDTMVHGFMGIFSMLSKWAKELYPELYEPVTKWTKEQVLDHVTDARKKEALKQAFKEIYEGECELIRKMVKAQSFTKMEKHYSQEYNGEELVGKSKQIPRLINAFHPHLNASLCQHTLPLSKALNKVFSPDTNILYAAGCAPSEINRWMNESLAYSHCILEDDVSMSDGSHSAGSFKFTEDIMKSALRDLDEALWYILKKIRHCKIKKQELAAFIEWVNNSGVPLTSWQNSSIHTHQNLRLRRRLLCGYCEH